MNDDIRSLMEEPPVPVNHGTAVDSFVDEGGAAQVTRRDLSGRLAKFDQKGLDTGDSRFGLVVGKDDGGLVAHRGVLQADEYVDWFALRAAVEDDLGFTYAQVNEAYAIGRPTTEQRQLREKIDSRLLALSRSGGNMEILAKALALSEKTIDRALSRAREIDVRPMVAHGVVKSTHVCFKCGEPGKLRKRRFSDSPTEWVGNIALCDAHYAAGFERKPGNPGYWEFRDATTPFNHPVRVKAPKRVQRFPDNYPSDESYHQFIGATR